MNSHKLLLIAILVSTLFSSCNMHEGGVRVSNNMEKYASEYINNKRLLNEGEKIIAYYDYTISCDGTEAAILTNKRLIYHNQQTTNTSINLNDITDIKYTIDSLIGYSIEVYSNDGNVLMIQIAPLQNGDTFLRLLKSKVSETEVNTK